jgi:hypothetical protein
MSTKVCFKCKEEKNLDSFYKHSRMKDGCLNKCKGCTKDDVHKNYSVKRTDPILVEKERKRGRDKYYRLNYSERKNKKERITDERYFEKFPEKKKAMSILGKKIKVEPGFHRHHWSYNDEHFLDIIIISIKDHNTSHRYLVYDQERMMYRTTENILLDSKEKHLEYINSKIEIDKG